MKENQRVLQHLTASGPFVPDLDQLSIFKEQVEKVQKLR